MKKILLLLALVGAIFLAYAPALRDGFVWDDTALILRDPLIRSWRLLPESFQHFLFIDATASDFYRPLQRLSYLADYAAFHFQPAGYHFSSIAWHAAAAVALYFFALELLRYFSISERVRRIVPFFVTLAWALHPLQTSAVVYISGRADPLAAAFGFLALYLGLRSLRTGGRAHWLLQFGASLALFLAALSKESGLIFLALWLALLLLRRHWKAALRAGVVALFVLVGYFTLRMGAEHYPAPRLHPPAPLLARPILIARAFAEYAGLIAFPADLRMERDVETRTYGMSNGGMAAAARKELQTLAGLILFCAFIYWLLRERRRDLGVFACLILSLVAYFPISGVIPLNATVAEHWLYVPSAFLFLALGLLAARLAQAPQPFRRTLIVTLAGIWMLFCAGRTFLRTFDWKDQRTFLERTIAAGSDSPRMLINLGGLELSEGQLDAAKKHLTTALEKEPDQPLALINLAAVALKQNDFPTAHALLKRAKEMPLVEAQAHEMGAVLESKETGKTNLSRLRLASRTGAPNWEIEKRYIKVMAESGDLPAALAELQHCLTTQWYRADSWKLLAVLKAQGGDRVGAKRALNRAHQLDVHLVPETAPL